MTYRDERVQCLRCGAGLEATASRWACAQCGGALVHAKDLSETLAGITPHDSRSLDGRMRPATSPLRRCPCCASAMTAYLLHDILVDRCSEHGVWFDPGELEQVLTTCAQRAAARHTAGFAALAVGGASAFAGLGYLVLGPALALPFLCVGAVGLGAGAIRRWRVRSTPVQPGE